MSLAIAASVTRRLVDPLPVLSRVDDEEELDADDDAFVSFAQASLPFPAAPESP